MSAPAYPPLSNTQPNGPNQRRQPSQTEHTYPHQYQHTNQLSRQHYYPKQLSTDQTINNPENRRKGLISLKATSKLTWRYKNERTHGLQDSARVCRGPSLCHCGGSSGVGNGPNWLQVSGSGDSAADELYCQRDMMALHLCQEFAYVPVNFS